MASPHAIFRTWCWWRSRTPQAVLAQNVGRALGFDTTAVMVMGPETATLSVVDSDDGSIVEARMCTLDGEDATDILPAMAATLETTNPKPGSVFVVGSRSAVCSVKSSLENLISQPVIVPEEPEFALARGAALAAANVPGSEASTCGWLIPRIRTNFQHSTKPR